MHGNPHRSGSIVVQTDHPFGLHFYGNQYTILTFCEKCHECVVWGAGNDRHVG
jgi:hypothetical protein